MRTEEHKGPAAEGKSPSVRSMSAALTVHIALAVMVTLVAVSTIDVPIVRSECDLPTPEPGSTSCDESTAALVTGLLAPQVGGALVEARYGGSLCGSTITNRYGNFQFQCASVRWPCACVQLTVKARGFAIWTDERSAYRLTNLRIRLVRDGAVVFIPIAGNS